MNEQLRLATVIPEFSGPAISTMRQKRRFRDVGGMSSRQQTLPDPRRHFAFGPEAHLPCMVGEVVIRARHSVMLASTWFTQRKVEPHKGLIGTLASPKLVQLWP
jgi:hypothetical protein